MLANSNNEPALIRSFDQEGDQEQQGSTSRAGPYSGLSIGGKIIPTIDHRPSSECGPQEQYVFDVRLRGLGRESEDGAAKGDLNLEIRVGP